jgi:hypothetical protein
LKRGKKWGVFFNVSCSYISNHGNDIPAQFHWSKNGRATPDVAALGIGFSVVVNGAVESIGGTSGMLTMDDSGVSQKQQSLCSHFCCNHLVSDGCVLIGYCSHVFVLQHLERPAAGSRQARLGLFESVAVSVCRRQQHRLF